MRRQIGARSVKKRLNLNSFFVIRALALILSLFSTLGAVSAELPLMNTPPTITISGISSGGFMAVQMATAFSSEISGLATVAGGFYYCAENELQHRIEEGKQNPLLGTKNLFLFQQTLTLGKYLPAPGNPLFGALTICMQNPQLGKIPDLKSWVEQNLIDHTDNIKRQKVYIYQGLEDSVVNPKMADRLVEFYKHNQVADDFIKVKSLKGGHNFPTDKINLNDCSNQSVPYISSCQFNLTEDFLQHLLGRKLVRSYPDVIKNFYLVDLNLEPVNALKAEKDWVGPIQSIAPYGYLYASSRCLNQPDQCHLHVALHGCEMSDSFDSEFDERYIQQVAKTRVLGMRNQEQRPWYLKSRVPIIEEKSINWGALKFALQAGYIELAEKNDIIFLFPQTWITQDNYPYNPKGCWDWFGYTGKNYATKKGPEMEWLMSYIRRIKQDPRLFLLPQKVDLRILKK